MLGPFEEEEEGTGITSDVVKVKGEDPATPGLLPTGIDPGTVTIPQYRVNKTKQHTHGTLRLPLRGGSRSQKHLNDVADYTGALLFLFERTHNCYGDNHGPWATPSSGQIHCSFGLIGEVCPGFEPVDRGHTRCLTIFEPQIPITHEMVGRRIRTDDLTPVAGLIFETKNRAIFLERIFGRGITAREQLSRAVILARF